MAYQALYRRYRPGVFSDVKGQEHITGTLSNQLHTDRIGHAYLFTGTRGTGKTTVARIFASAVNCMEPAEDGSPCGKCHVCEAISAGTSMNVIEIDAASNSSVDNMRQLIEEVEYPPTEGRYKVYIIDEVHMLSTAAFNALLKTLEEPPGYVIFILATTEVHKVPITIMSRCQRYDFKRITIDTMVSRMKSLMESDRYRVEERGLAYIARRADGSMRDALSLLDQCISFYPEGGLTYDNILSVLGAVDIQEFSSLLRRLNRQDVPGVIALIDEIIMQGRELLQFVVDFTWYLRNLMLLKAADNMEELLDVSTENITLMKEEADMTELVVIMRYINILSEVTAELKASSQKRALLEVALIRLMKPQMDDDYAAVIDRLIKLEAAVENGVAINAASPKLQGAALEKKEINELVKVEKFPEAVEDDIRQVCTIWKQIIRDADPGLANWLSYGMVTVSEDGRNLLLVFDDEDKLQATAYKQLSQPDVKERIEALVSNHVNANVPIVLKLDTSPLDRAHKYTDAIDRFAQENGLEIIEEQ